MKYRVKKKCQLLYPDGSVRGEAGYIVDSSTALEFETIDRQGDVLEVCRDRQTPASPVDLARLQMAYGDQQAAAPVAAEPAAEEPQVEEEPTQEDKSFADSVIDLVLKGWNKMPKDGEDIEE